MSHAWFFATHYARGWRCFTLAGHPPETWTAIPKCRVKTAAPGRGLLVIDLAAVVIMLPPRAAK
jgi:hypothetical protein